MARFLHQDNSYPSRRLFCHCLALFWTAGLSCGIWSWFTADSSLSSLMRGCPVGSVSIVSLLCVTFLPFLLSAFAVLFSSLWLLMGISFGKGFLFSFVSMGTFAGFGCAGWLVRLLLCFSDLFCLPLLYGFWLRCFPYQGNRFRAGALLTGSLMFLIGSVDYCLIAPFLADLITL